MVDFWLIAAMKLFNPILSWCSSPRAGMKHIQLRSSCNDDEFASKLEFQNLPCSTILRYEISQRVLHDVLKRCRNFVSLLTTLVVLLCAHWPLMAFTTVCHLLVVALLFRFVPKKPAQRISLQPETRKSRFDIANSNDSSLLQGLHLVVVIRQTEFTESVWPDCI